MTASPAVEVRDLRFHYPEGDFSLAIESLHVRPRESLAIMGPSGSGKTTLLQLLAGILVSHAGRVEVAGVDWGTLSEAQRRARRLRQVGLVFQSFELISYLDVLDNVLLPFRLGGGLQLDAAARHRATTLVQAVGLEDKRHRRVQLLSTGERQRVAIARALATGASLVLADEPTGNLDLQARGVVLDVLFDQVQAHGATLVTVTHDRDVAARFDHIIDFESLPREPSGA